jgi:hypothetical protein
VALVGTEGHDERAGCNKASDSRHEGGFQRQIGDNLNHFFQKRNTVIHQITFNKNLFILPDYLKILMATKTWAIALILFMTLITSTAQILYKLAAQRFELSVAGILMNWPLIVGGILYLISSVMMIIAFKGGEISVLYPLIALSYVWVGILSQVLLGDIMSPLKWAGVAFIIGGVSFIGFGGRK